MIIEKIKKYRKCPALLSPTWVEHTMQCVCVCVGRRSVCGGVYYKLLCVCVCVFWCICSLLDGCRCAIVTVCITRPVCS